jgi:hypothetical protein
MPMTVICAGSFSMVCPWKAEKLMRSDHSIAFSSEVDAVRVKKTRQIKLTDHYPGQD